MQCPPTVSHDAGQWGGHAPSAHNRTCQTLSQGRLPRGGATRGLPDGPPWAMGFTERFRSKTLPGTSPAPASGLPPTENCRPEAPRATPAPGSPPGRPRHPRFPRPPSPLRALGNQTAIPPCPVSLLLLRLPLLRFPLSLPPPLTPPPATPLCQSIQAKCNCECRRREYRLQ